MKPPVKPPVKSLRAFTVAALVALVALVALACNDSTSVGPPASVVKSGGDGQAGHFNTALPIPYSVTVYDANNHAVPGVYVNWAIVTGGGSLSADSSKSDSHGVASTTHTLSMATVYVVRATVAAVPSVTFSATASAALESTP